MSKKAADHLEDGVAADRMNGATGKVEQNPKDAAKKTREIKNTGERIKKHNR